MVGSRRFFLYITDGGEEFAIERDESLTEAINSTEDIAPVPAGTPGKDVLLEPRRMRYNSQNGQQSVDITLLNNTEAAYNAVPATVQVNRSGSNVVYYLTSYIGERRRFVPGIDTLQTDTDEEGSIVANP